MITSKRLPLYVAGGAAVSALAVVLGLTVSHSGSHATTAEPSSASTTVTTRNTDLGRLLVDARGRTLYLFAKDAATTSACVGDCAADWPPVPAPAAGVPSAGGGATATSLRVIARPDGTRQLSYAGHPLYYFVGDPKAGQTSGEGLDQFGAKWYALDSAGAAVTSANTNAGSGGYGY